MFAAIMLQSRAGSAVLVSMTRVATRDDFRSVEELIAIVGSLIDSRLCTLCGCICVVVAAGLDGDFKQQLYVFPFGHALGK